jgi:hypothetical protein
MMGKEEKVKMKEKEKEQRKTDNEIKKKSENRRKETDLRVEKKEERDYVHLRRDGTSGGSADVVLYLSWRS